MNVKPNRFVWGLLLLIVLLATALVMLFPARRTFPSDTSSSMPQSPKAPLSGLEAPVQEASLRPLAGGSQVAGMTTAAPPRRVSATVLGPAATAEGAALIEQYRRQSNAILRREALKTWHREGRSAALEVATAAVLDPDPTVVLQALQILESAGRRDSTPVLAQVLEQNLRRPDGYGLVIRQEAIRALGRCGDHSVTPLLTRELEKHSDLGYDTTLVAALGQVGDRSALATLEQHLRRLEERRPSEAIALEPWKQAVQTAQLAIQTIKKQNGL
jgi:HEAT repeat protein